MNIDLVLNNVDSALLYLFAFGMSTFLMYLFYKKTHLSSALRYGILCLSLLIPILLMGIKTSIDVSPSAHADYGRYVLFSEQVSKISIGEFISEGAGWGQSIPGFEVSFWFISNISFWLTGSPHLVFLLYGALAIIIFYLGLRILPIRPSNKWAVYFVYLFTLFPSFPAIRQAPAYAICFLAISLLLASNSNKKYIYYALLAVLSSIFHISGLVILAIALAIYLLSLLFLSKKYKKYALPVVAGVSIVFVGMCILAEYIIPHLPIISSYSDYLSDRYMNGGSMFPLVRSIMFILLIYLLMRTGSAASNNHAYIYMTLLCIPAILIGMPYLPSAAYRIADFFGMFIFLTPLLILLESKVNSKRTRLARSVVFCAVIGYTIGLYMFYNYSLMLPYTTWLL